MSILVFLLPLVSPTPAEADQPSPGHASVSALTAKVAADAARIHQLTEQLDEARLQASTASAHLGSVTDQYDVTVQSLDANRSVLVNQAVQAYMEGGISVQDMTSSQASDLTVSQEYLQMASGDLTQTGDQLHQLELKLRAQQSVLRSAQQAKLQAAQGLDSLRASAVAVAGNDQVQLVSLQAQITAAANAAAAAAAKAQANAQAKAAARAAAQPASPQGLPVNNGLVTTVQRAAGLPIATPVSSTSKPAPVASSGGGGAGGVWLALRMCESSDNYAENTGNGFYGAYQFSQSTWTGLGYPGRPDLEPPAMQDAAAMKDQSISGWGQWPACAAALGLL